MLKLTKLALRSGLATSLLIGLSPAASACASCGCTLTADWLSQGLAAQPGTTFSLRYDFIPQTLLRNGTDNVDRNSLGLPSDIEIQRHTYNHSLTMTLDHQFANDWGLDVQLPLVTRPHSTFAPDTTEPSHSDTQGIGDLRVTARWQGLSKPGSVTGLEAGLVLPTGQFTQSFDSGPALGEEVDRGLQPGTGTVQAVIGAYHLAAITPELGYFVQANAQTALDDRHGYRPGSFVQLSGALNYTHWRNITPQLQISFRATAKDSGPDADRPNSGGVQVNVAPGLSAKLTSKAVGFTYIELPLYSHVNGYQLIPRAKLSLGVLVHI